LYSFFRSITSDFFRPNALKPPCAFGIYVFIEMFVVICDAYLFLPVIFVKQFRIQKLVAGSIAAAAAPWLAQAFLQLLFNGLPNWFAKWTGPLRSKPANPN
jgi:hypothetical protein